MLYFKGETSNTEIRQPLNYILKPSDIIYIRINSTDDHINTLLMSFLRDDYRGTVMSEAAFYINSSIIAPDSTVTIPIVGTIKAAGYTLNEFEKKLQNAINEVVIETTVYVRLMSYRITVLGEVSRPGVITFFQPNATVLDAIARAGDITHNAKRSELLIIRNNSNSLEQYSLDLSDINILNSPGFYIYPDDVIYVRPKLAKAFRENLPMYSFMLSIITTFILIFSVIDKK